MAKLGFNIAFFKIKNYLVGKAIGITRAKSLLNEVVKCLFCKKFYIPLDSNILLSSEQIANNYRNAFNELKENATFIFDINEEILLDPDSIAYVDKIFDNCDFSDFSEDPFSILYEMFISSEIRGTEGQFFTPYEAVRWIVEAVDPKVTDKIIDPACGAGSFLSYAANYLISRGARSNQVSDHLFGIEKDEYLSKLAKTHIALTTLSNSNIVCADSVERKTNTNEQIPFPLDESFDIVIANPPFGAKIKIGTEETKKHYDLAHKWSKNRSTGVYEKSNRLLVNPTPQTLFLELCLKLLRPYGKLGVVVPESLITNFGNGYVVQFLRKHSQINAIIGMPESLFKTSGKGGTHTKTCLLIATKKEFDKKNNSKIFMAEAKWCGHDSRGNKIPFNDLPIILKNFKALSVDINDDNLGYWLKNVDIVENILAPRYYNPDVLKELNKLSETHHLIKIRDLVKKDIIEITTGDEIGKLSYGSGNIPFIRTSDISNWEVKLDPKHGVSEKIYQQFKDKQDVQEGDILMVKDGTYLIGTCAYISKYDTRILFQSHLYKIRIKDRTKLSPFLFLAALSSNPVKSQIQGKRFTQDIIDSLGKRIYELILPIPKDQEKKEEIEEMVKKSINDRIFSRELARKAIQMISKEG